MCGLPALLETPNTKYPAVNAFSTSLRSQDLQVQIRTLSLLCSLCRAAPRSVALPYVQALAPQVIQWCLGPTLPLPNTEAELSLALGCLDLLDTLLSVALPERLSQLLSLILPILVHFLVDDVTSSLATASVHKLSLHDTSLARLTRLGGMYPQEFKAILSSNTDMSERVKRAVVANTEKMKARQLAAVSRVQAPAPPSITLKMDFSNFK